MNPGVRARRLSHRAVTQCVSFHMFESRGNNLGERIPYTEPSCYENYLKSILGVTLSHIP